MVKAKEVVTLWSYYDYPPFVISMSDQKGLNFDFVEMLNLFETDSPYEYKLKMVPRKRLDTYLKSNQKGAVLWVNPMFFADNNREKYAWTKRLLEDEQSFVSRSQTPFIYKGPESLMAPGFVLGGVRGHLYGGIQKEIDTGKIVRSDVSNAKQNIGMLLKNRVSTFLIPLSTMKYFEKEMKLSHKIYYSPKPLSAYTRHILVNHDDAVFNALAKVVNKIDQDEYWKTLLDQYGLSLPR
jgi:polar amino acid transport system substrate-binding protein